MRARWFLRCRSDRSVRLVAQHSDRGHVVPFSNLAGRACVPGTLCLFPGRRDAAKDSGGKWKVGATLAKDSIVSMADHNGCCINRI